MRESWRDSRAQDWGCPRHPRQIIQRGPKLQAWDAPTSPSSFSTTIGMSRLDLSFYLFT